MSFPLRIWMEDVLPNVLNFVTKYFLVEKKKKTKKKLVPFFLYATYFVGEYYVYLNKMVIVLFV